MKKRQRVMAWGMVLLALVAWSCWPRRPDPEIGLGPHKTRVQWVTYDQAHPAPIVKFTWPWGTPFAFPRSTITNDDPYSTMTAYPLNSLGIQSVHVEVPVQTSLNQPDDPNLVAGYLLVETDCATLYRDKDTEAWGASGDKSPAVIKDCYATTPQARRAVLEAGFMEGEKVDVVLPYDPSKIAARVKPSMAKAGPYTLRLEFDTDRSGSDVYLRLAVLGAENADDFLVTYTNGSIRGDSPLSVPAVRMPSGDYKFEGTICPVRPPYYWPNPKRTYPISVVMHVSPLAN